ncbi:MAG: DciA family protein [Gammaproteobacteria bacterium]
MDHRPSAKHDTGNQVASDKGSLKGLGELLGADSALAQLARTAGRQVEVADCVRQQLSTDLAGAIAACNLRPDGTLVVTALSPEWAARLRFEADAILTGCRVNWPAAARVQIRVGRA